MAKTFTAAAVLKLEERGKLRLTDAITAYLPNIPDDKRAITIAQLLTHTSGLTGDVRSKGANPFADEVGRDEVAARILATPLEFEPGKQWSYSNGGYVLLAAIVENSGMRSDKPLRHGEITSSIVDSFFEVHGELGFGFREYLYARALERRLIEKGHKVDREVAVMVHFRGEPLAYERMDMVVDGKVIIENKAREPLDADAQGQLFAGLAATNLEVGLVLHFGKKARFSRVFFENQVKIGATKTESTDTGPSWMSLWTFQPRSNFGVHEEWRFREVGFWIRLFDAKRWRQDLVVKCKGGFD